MHTKTSTPTFNPPHTRFHESKRRHLFYLQEFSLYDDLDINEKQMTKDATKKDVSPPTPLDPILHYVEAFQERYN
jgi:hypothetical protein